MDAISCQFQYQFRNVVIMSSRVNGCNMVITWYGTSTRSGSLNRLPYLRFDVSLLWPNYIMNGPFRGLSLLRHSTDPVDRWNFQIYGQFKFVAACTNHEQSTRVTKRPDTQSFFVQVPVILFLKVCLVAFYAKLIIIVLFVVLYKSMVII